MKCNMCNSVFIQKYVVQKYCSRDCQKRNTRINWNKSEKARQSKLEWWHANKPRHKVSDRLYRIWCGMKVRCFNPNRKCYGLYGGRGITVTPSWLDFSAFKKDMGDSYNLHTDSFGEVDTSLDRINNDGNYCKENCRWATKKVQAQNRS